MAGSPKARQTVPQELDLIRAILNEKRMKDLVGVKWVRSGNFLEIYHYKNIEWVNRSSRVFKQKDGSEIAESKEERKSLWKLTDKGKKAEKKEMERRKQISLEYTKKQLRRRVYANVGKWPEPNGKYTNPTFLTLTIHEGGDELKIANGMFMRFIKRLNYFVTGEKDSFVKYLAVPEFQKRGAVHYHCIFFNLSYIPKKKIEELWSHGFIKVEQIDELAGSVEYVLKYMRKDLASMVPKGMKRYLISRGLHGSVIARGGDYFVNELSTHSIWLDDAQIHATSYSGEWCGNVDFFLYDLSSQERCMPYILALEERYGVHSVVKENICDTLSMLESPRKTAKDKNSQLELKFRPCKNEGNEKA